jgi:hypothetical protein
MKCECPLFKGDGGCLIHGLVMTEGYREQCRSSKEFFDGFAHVGAKRRRKPAPSPGRAQKKAKRKPDKTPAEPPCIFRGNGIAANVKCVPCSSGGRSSTEVFVCAVHFRCTMHNVSLREGKRLEACVTCDERREPLQLPGTLTMGPAPSE